MKELMEKMSREDEEKKIEQNRLETLRLRRKIKRDRLKMKEMEAEVKRLAQQEKKILERLAK